MPHKIAGLGRRGSPSANDMGKKPERPKDVSLEQRRERLWRRLLWKAPVILLLVSFALWWQWRQESRSLPASGVAPEAISRMAKAIEGIWEGEVTYGRGAQYTERFFLQAEDDKLFGTASFRGLKRGIENGKIEGDRVTFTVRYEEVAGSVARGVTNYYAAWLSGGGISVRIQDSRGTPPVEFKMIKSPEAG